jgi:hypothetical protein
MPIPVANTVGKHLQMEIISVLLSTPHLKMV